MGKRHGFNKQKYGTRTTIIIIEMARKRQGIYRNYKDGVAYKLFRVEKSHCRCITA